MSENHLEKKKLGMIDATLYQLEKVVRINILPSLKKEEITKINYTYFNMFKH